MQIEEDKFTHAIARGEKQIGLWISLCLSQCPCRSVEASRLRLAYFSFTSLQNR